MTVVHCQLVKTGNRPIHYWHEMSPRESSITVTVKSNDVCGLLFSETANMNSLPTHIENVFTSPDLRNMCLSFQFSFIFVQQFPISFPVSLLPILLHIFVDFSNQSPVPSRENFPISRPNA